MKIAFWQNIKVDLTPMRMMPSHRATLKFIKQHGATSLPLPDLALLPHITLRCSHDVMRVNTRSLGVRMRDTSQTHYRTANLASSLSVFTHTHTHGKLFQQATHTDVTERGREVQVAERRRGWRMSWRKQGGFEVRILAGFPNMDWV